MDGFWIAVVVAISATISGTVGPLLLAWQFNRAAERRTARAEARQDEVASKVEAVRVAQELVGQQIARIEINTDGNLSRVQTELQSAKSMIADLQTLIGGMQAGKVVEP